MNGNVLPDSKQIRQGLQIGPIGGFEATTPTRRRLVREIQGPCPEASPESVPRP